MELPLHRLMQARATTEVNCACAAAHLAILQHRYAFYLVYLPAAGASRSDDNDHVGCASNTAHHWQQPVQTPARRFLDTPVPKSVLYASNRVAVPL